MDWCCQATGNYLDQCWPRFMSPYNATRPQCVKKTKWHEKISIIFKVKYNVSILTFNICLIQLMCVHTQSGCIGGSVPHFELLPRFNILDGTEVDIDAVLISHQVLLSPVLRRTYKHHPVTFVLVCALEVGDVSTCSLHLQCNKDSLNSLRPSDAIWRHRSWSTLAQVMACCLTAPSHYLNQCWLIISKV